MGEKYVKKVFYSTSSIQNGRTYNSIITLDKVQKTGNKYYFRWTNFFENSTALEINLFIYLFHLINKLESVGFWELEGGIY